MSAPLARLSSAPGLPALLWTPARWWLPPRQQLEQQRPSLQDLLLPSAVVPSAPSAPARLESRLSPPAGRRAQGAGTREGLPEPGCAPPTSDPLGSRLGAGGLGRRSPQPISNAWTRWRWRGEMLGRRGSQLPLSASVSGLEMELDLGTPEEVWVGTDYPHLPPPHGRGVVWVGPASPAKAPYSSSVSSVCLSQPSPQPLLFPPSARAPPPARASSPSPY